LLTAGVDEAGRGPLAGPVGVAAVILDPARPIAGLDDSKRLSAERREVLYDEIIERARAFHVVLITCREIDRINILQATLMGMRHVVRGLVPAADYALIDGNRVPETLPCPARAVIDGDHLHAAISAASILAKVTRDRYMVALDARYPGYGFARHKGYGVPAHLDALARLGPCAEHRHSFAPVRACLQALAARR
jgi:ribonuclease HII